MKTKVYLPFLLCFLFNSIMLNAQTYEVSAGTYGGKPNPTSPNVIGTYVYSGTLAPDNKPYYTKISGNSNPSYCFYINGFWDISPELGNDAVSVNYYYNYNVGASSGSTFPVGSYSMNWSSDYGAISTTQPPVTAQNSTVNMTFTDGSSHNPSNGNPGTSDNVIGRFYLKGNAVGGVLQAVTISLTGTRSGITNVKLYSSTDNSFGSDQLLSTKSDASSVTFDGFNSLVDNSSGTYYFITIDLLAGATGAVTATIPSQSSFTFASGSANAPSSFSNAPLSSAAVPLPVELNTFSAIKSENSVELKWSTATEVNNYGFEIQRSEVGSQKSAASWTKIGFVKGNGNSNSPKDYTYTDNSNLSSGKYSYRLKQIDNDGQFEYSKVVDVSFNAPTEFSLKQNYPNPFNPSTVISYALPSQSYVTIKVYDILGNEVASLVNKEQAEGEYKITFDANNLSSGIYFYKLTAGNFVNTMKMILLVKVHYPKS